jgi:hypothetical protein
MKLLSWGMKRKKMMMMMMMKKKKMMMMMMMMKKKKKMRYPRFTAIELCVLAISIIIAAGIQM